MIKFMIHLVKVIVALCVSLLFSSCKYDIELGESITGSGKVVSIERNIAAFSKVEVSDGLDCEVTQGDKIQVVIEADDNVQDGIITTVENGTLIISSKYNRYKNVTSKKVKVVMPTVDGLQTSSGSHLETKNIIKGTNITLKSSSGSELIANVEADKITLESSSGSTIEAQGKALEIETSSSSGSEIDAEHLLANNVTSQTSSGSNTTVNPILSLTAKASSGSSIEYAKAPKTISKQQSSGGSVSLK